jgi:hypothetical protein
LFTHFYTAIRSSACNNLGDDHGWRVNRIVFALAIAGTLFLSACGFFGSGEEVRQQPRRTVYRSAEEIPTDEPIIVPKKEKVPGE